MSKREFIASLRERLQSLPAYEVEKTIAYYEELIADYVEIGMTEEEAVARLGNINDIVNNTFQERSIPELVRANIHTKKSGSTNFKPLLFLLTFPLWFPLLMTGFGLLMALVFTVFGLGIGVAAIAIAAVAALIAAVVLLFQASFGGALFALGAALLFGGLSKLILAPGFRGLSYVVDKTRLGFRIIKDKLVSKLRGDEE